MDRSIYNKFSYWYHGGNIWLYSDPHFGDEDMKFLRTNNISDEEQVKRINSKVGKNDTIIFLGDIGNTEFVKKIRGYKVLIMGNHDAGASNYKRAYITNEDNHLIDNHLFDEVYEGPLFISDKILLSHEPITLPFVINLHGHTHDLPYRSDDTHYNFCAEAINYTPVSLISLINSGMLSKVDTIHRTAINAAIRRREKSND